MRLSQILNKDRIIACNQLMITVMVILRSTEYLMQGYDVLAKQSTRSILTNKSLFLRLQKHQDHVCVATY